MASTSPPPSPPQYTKAHVARLVQAAASSRLRHGLPHDFSFKDGKLYFLASTPTSSSSTLKYVNIPFQLVEENIKVLPVVQPHFVISPNYSTTNRKLTKEELLLRERQRVHDFGVTSYFHSNDSSQTPRVPKILIPAAGKLLVAEDKGDEFFSISSEHPANGALDPKWSADGQLIAFVRDSGI